MTEHASGGVNHGISGATSRCVADMEFTFHELGVISAFTYTAIRVFAESEDSTFEAAIRETISSIPEMMAERYPLLLNLTPAVENKLRGLMTDIARQVLWEKFNGPCVYDDSTV
jgi:hypothetical protein